MLIHAGALVRPPPLQHRTVSSLHPYAAMERSSTPVSPVPEPRCRSMGQLSLPTRMQTLLVQRLYAHLQRSHQHLAPSKQAVAGVLDSRHLPVVSVVFVATYCQGVRYPYPYELSLVLVAAECRAVL